MDQDFRLRDLGDFLLTVEDLWVEYQTDYVTNCAVNGISFSLLPGENLGFVGETGAGKTTTALGLMGLLPRGVGQVTRGRIMFQERDLLTLPEAEMRLIRGNLISMIFQDPMTSLNPILTVGNQIAEVLKYHAEDKSIIDEKVDELLNLVGISASRKDDYPHQFSGGMKQRIVIAIAIACNPALLIADEPTTALDVTIQAQVLEMMDELKKQLNTSMIMITHDLGIVAQVCDKVAIMYSGEIVQYGSVEDIFNADTSARDVSARDVSVGDVSTGDASARDVSAGDSVRRHPYTEGLFGSIPDLTKTTVRLTPIGGQMTDPSQLPEGCKFHPRCTHCMDICRKDNPPAVEVSPGHFIKCHRSIRYA